MHFTLSRITTANSDWSQPFTRFFWEKYCSHLSRKWRFVSAVLQWLLGFVSTQSMRASPRARPRRHRSDSQRLPPTPTLQTHSGYRKRRPRRRTLHDHLHQRETPIKTEQLKAGDAFFVIVAHGPPSRLMAPPHSVVAPQHLQRSAGRSPPHSTQASLVRTPCVLLCFLLLVVGWLLVVGCWLVFAVGCLRATGGRQGWVQGE